MLKYSLFAMVALFAILCCSIYMATEESRLQLWPTGQSKFGAWTQSIAIIVSLHFSKTDSFMRNRLCMRSVSFPEMYSNDHKNQLDKTTLYSNHKISVL